VVLSLSQILTLVVSLIVLGASLLLLVICYVAGRCSEERATGVISLGLVLLVASAVVSVGALLA
jgi:hypothetical protein